MNLDRFLTGMGRRLLRRFLMKGVHKGIDHAFSAKDGSPPTREEKQRSRQARQMARKARQGAKLARRMGRF